MELLQLTEHTLEETVIQPDLPQFIEGNAISVGVDEIKSKHIIPVFAKNNEPLISHSDFIESVQMAVMHTFKNEHVLEPVVKVSHAIKGRIPEAKTKPANQLQDYEKTLYYERMAFTIELPSIHQTVNGNELTLSVGGVKAYNRDNVYSRKPEQSFKLFIGFKNFVCTNLCLNTDGYKSELFVSTIPELITSAFKLFKSYDLANHISQLEQLNQHYLNENQLAQILGKARMYQYLPKELKRHVTQLKLSDTQLSQVANGYYNDPNFCRDIAGNISLWKLYNLLTGANKSSYIDSFLDRGVNAHSFSQELSNALNTDGSNWFLN